MRTSYLVAVALLLAAIFKPEISSAYTISVDCVFNGVPPPTIPYQNVLCSYAWQQGGQAINLGGRVSADLQYWGTSPPSLMDHWETAIFNFNHNTYTSPIKTWIQCSDLQGSFRAYMTGDLYKYVIGTLSSPGYWSIQDLQTDAEFTFITRTVPC